jgi:hypothetical protein
MINRDYADIGSVVPDDCCKTGQEQGQASPLLIVQGRPLQQTRQRHQVRGDAGPVELGADEW